MHIQKEDPLYDVFNKISDAIIITDLNYNIKAWNKAAEIIYGWKAEEILGRNIFDTINIEYVDQSPNEIKNEFEETGSWKGNVIQYKKGGKKTHIYSSVSIIMDKTGKEDRIVAINQDITERRKIEKKLRRSEQKYRRIIENAHEGIWLIDDEGYTTFVNKRMAEILGYSPEEMMNKHLFEFCDRKYKEIAKNNIERRKKGIEERHEFIFKRRNGEKVFTHMAASPLFNEKNEYEGALALVFDITAKKEAEKRLKETQKNFREIAEQSLVGIQIVQDGRIVYINEKAANFSGLKGKDIKHLTFQNSLKYIHPDDLERIKTQYLNRVEKTKNFKESYQFRTIDTAGNVRWIESLNKTIKYKRKDADIIFLVDITDIKRNEQKLRISESKIQEAFNRANFYKDLLIHDINNILQVITSSKELLSYYAKERVIDDDFVSFLNMIERQAKKGEILVSNIYKISELEEKEVELEPIEVFKVLTRVIEYIKDTYKNKDIKVEIKSDFSQYIIQANQLLEEVFENLLINSIKYNENEKIEIIIKISEEFIGEKKNLQFQFIDNGIGVEEEKKSLIFQKGKKVSKVSNGLGFGLSLVKIIVKKFQGDIWVEDRIKGIYKKGSNFVIQLPIESIIDL